ncbi:LysR substrate-binding domain-containing protein [Pseudomonas sp. CR3202]|uniref:LysR substrate-binding domain-containing protein n=1 Tax=Pseudomonas sp. CR3202 TaxID=3351532 RepID=UPI003BF00E0D
MGTAILKPPIFLDPDKFIGLRLGADAFIPVSAPDADGKPLFQLPGSSVNPILYLAYTATSFLGRVVEIIFRGESQQPHLKRFYEADMAMHLMRMAREGYGISWQPELAVEEVIAAGRLVRAGEGWSAELEIWSFRSISNPNQTILELWRSLENDVR